MSCVVVVGSQWGDEGKGKVVDFLTEQADVVARYQGGNNAGHTVVFHNQTHILHLIPSGIFREGKITVLGSGVVVDPNALVTEIELLRERGIEIGTNFRVSDQANLIMPYHQVLDQLREAGMGEGKIGTTGRGIGPAYEDKMARKGVRFGDLRPDNAPAFQERLRGLIAEKNMLLRTHFGSETSFDADQVAARYAALYAKVAPHICDTSMLLNQAIDAGQRVLFEGAQGTLLDVDHGTYPFVTSSSTIAGGACTGCGVGPTKIDGVVGITKAYTTRVGEGPLPTELHDEVGQLLQEEGGELGATTGRQRRCGWFDAVVVRGAARINGMTGLAVTKLDVLDKLETVKIAIAYRDQDGTEYADVPHLVTALESLKPVYEELPGWKSPTRGIVDYDALPEQARAYLDRISELTKVPISLVSTGPGREETIQLQSTFPNRS